MISAEVLKIKAKLKEMDDLSKMRGENFPNLTEEREQLVRRMCELQYSKSPLWEEKAKKDPNFWQKFSPGRIR